jgi:hypothetical protein
LANYFLTRAKIVEKGFQRGTERLGETIFCVPESPRSLKFRVLAFKTIQIVYLSSNMNNSAFRVSGAGTAVKIKNKATGHGMDRSVGEAQNPHWI